MPSHEKLLAQLIGGDDTQAEYAAQNLPEFGEAAFHDIKKLINHPDADIQWWGMRALCEFGTPEVTQIFIEKLVSGTEAVQQCAALGLSIHAHEDAIPNLIKLFNHENGLLVRLAGNALVETGKPATPALLEVLDSDSATRNARLEATRALGMIGDPKAIAALFKLIDDDSALLEYWANEGLDKMGIGMTFFDPE